MRLLEINLKNYRVHRDITVKFSSTIHVVGGRNEVGKSTLAEAIHRVLFLKADSTTEYHKRMKSDFGGDPEIRLRFEQDGKTYVLFKRFLKNQVTKFGVEGKAEFSDAQADTELSNIIHALTGIGKTGLTTQWAHLWTWQEQNMDSPLGKDLYPHQELILQVQKLGGGGAMQSSMDRKVADKLIARRDVFFTTKTAALKAESPAAKAKGSVLTHMSDVDDARKVLEEIQASLEQVRSSEENIEAEKSSQALLQADLDKHTAQLEEIEKQEKILSGITQQVAQADDKHKSLKDIKGKIDLQRKKITETENELAGIEKELAPFSLASAEAKVEAEACRRTAVAAYGERDKLQKAATLAQQAIDRIEILEKQATTLAEISKAEKADALIEELRKKLAAIPGITRKDITALAKLGDVVNTASAALEAMGVSVTLDKAGQKVSIDGSDVSAGQSRIVTDAAVINIGDDVTISLSPKNGDISSQRKALELARQRFEAELQKFGVDSLTTAEANLSSRDDILSQIQRSESERGSASAADLRKQISQFDNDLIQQDAKYPESKQEALTDKTGMQAEKKRLSPLVRDAIANAETKGAELTAAEKRLAATLEGQAGLADRVTKTKADLKDLQSQLTGMLSNQGSMEQLAKAIADAESARVKLGNEHASAKAGIAKLEPDLVRSAIKMKRTSLEKSAGRLTESQQTSNLHRGIIKGRTSGDPKLTLATAIAKLEAAQAEYLRENSLAEALKLLGDTFESTQAELNKEFTGPLVSKIDEYAKILFGHDASIEMSQKEGKFTEPVLVRPQRGQNSTASFDKLSGGAKEQFSAAIRLAMAEVLSQSHDGHLPVLFDDTFSYTDSENLNKVHLMLNHAAEKGLQIILFTHSPALFKAMGADETNL